MNQEEIKLRDIFIILKKRIKSIVVITAFIGVLSTILNFYIAVPMYESNARIFIGMSKEDNRQYNMNELKTYKEFISTYVEIIKTKDLINKAIDDANVDRNAKEVLDNLEVVDIDNTQIIQITYKDTDPYLVKNIVDSISQEFINKSKEIIPGGSAELIETIELPDEPAYPKKKLNLLISIVMGFILSSVLAIFVENFGDKQLSAEQIESISELMVIGSIPKYKRCKGVF